MTLQEQLREDMKQAMRDKNASALTAIRGVMSAMTNELVTLGRTPTDALSDEEAVVVIKREVKRRKDAIDQFTAGGRPDLAEDDKMEVETLSKYLPVMMSVEAIKEIALAKQAELGLTEKADSGKLMGAIIKETSGAADGADVKAVVESLFN